MSQAFKAVVVGGPFDGVRYEGMWPPLPTLELGLVEGTKAVYKLKSAAGRLVYRFLKTISPGDPPTWTVEYVGLPAIDGYTRTINWPPMELADYCTLAYGPHLWDENVALEEAHCRTAIFQLRHVGGVYRYHFLRWDDAEKRSDACEAA